MWSCRRIIAAGCLGLLATLPVPAEVKVGDLFPALAEAGLAGGEVPSTAGKVVLVDFWASWCAPCKASFPFFGRLHREYASRGLVIVAVSVDEKSAAYDGFLRRVQPPFGTWRDAGQRLVSTVQVPAMPSSYLVDRTGRVRFTHRGFQGRSTELEIQRQVETLLAEKEQP